MRRSKLRSVAPMSEGYSSAYGPPSDLERARRAEPDAHVRGAGWIVFAGLFLVLVGVLNVLFGVAAISNSRFFVRHAAYVVSNLKALGWVMLAIGVLQVCAALAVWRERAWGRIVGIVTAAGNAIAQMLWMPGRPYAAIALFAMDILVLYGLIRWWSLDSTDIASAR